MNQKIDFSIATSGQIEKSLCAQLVQIRLTRNITQAQLAEEAGVSLKTIARMEKGAGVTLDTFIRILMAFQLQGNLRGLLPNPAVRPVERVARTGKERRRARPARPGGEPPASWAWGDEKDDES